MPIGLPVGCSCVIVTVKNWAKNLVGTMGYGIRCPPFSDGLPTAIDATSMPLAVVVGLDRCR
jgi:hypothetical protein